MSKRKKLKLLKREAEDHWTFKVDLMLDDFKDLVKRVEKLEVRLK